jgi:hypothetical protein
MATQKFAAFGGIRNTLAGERLGLAVKQAGGIDQRMDLVDAVNIDLDDSGRAARRAGQTTRVAGAAHSLWAEDGLCFFVQDGQLKQLHPDFTTTGLRGGMGGNTVHYIAVNGRVYWTDGVQTGAIVAGQAQSWGMPAALYQPQAHLVAGALVAGTYLYAMTYLRDDGQESGTGTAERIDVPDGGGLQFAWPAPTDPHVAEVALYVSTPNGETLYQALVADAAADSATFTGGSLALPLNSQWCDAPPAGQALAYHRGRIYIAQGAFLYATTALGYSYVDLRDYLAVDDSPIGFVLGVEHGLYVGTERATYFLKGDNLAEMTLTCVVDGFGVAGSALLVDGFAATGDAKLAGSQCAMFATGLGICLGTPSGDVVNLTFDRYRSNMARIGSAVLKVSDTTSQYLLTLGG